MQYIFISVYILVVLHDLTAHSYLPCWYVEVKLNI